jgi:hypothetical protein
MTDQLVYEGTLTSWDGESIVLEAANPPGADCSPEELAAWSARCVDINVLQLRQHLRDKKIRITIDILE